VSELAHDIYGVMFYYCLSANRRIPSGELCLVNSLQIHQILQTMNDFARRADTDKQYGDILTKINADIRTVYENTANAQAFISLQDLTEELCQRMNRQEESCARKLDRSELNNLQSLVQTVQTYKQFKDNTTESLAQMLANIRSHTEQIDALTISSNDTENRIRAISEEMRKFALKTECNALSKQLQHQQEQLNLCALREELRKVCG
jgi:K+/H+ antiporter YhaU regulatory subunit KhtT